MNPEIYATSWLLTFFSAKLQLDLLYTFWDNYILFNDKYLIIFFALAWILHFKSDLINKPPEQVPLTLANS
jgi:hypothetical protein